MMDVISAYWAEWLLLVSVFSVAVMAPGPDFLMAIRNSLTYSRKAGIYTALGFGLGVAVHVFYSIVGIATIIAKSVLLFTLIKFVGAGYLFYIGYKSLRSKGYQKDAETHSSDMPKTKHMKPTQALWSGFVTNLFNPKATLFFLALFTQILSPDTLVLAKVIYGTTCIIMVSAWFSFVAVVLTNPRIKNQFLKASKWIDRVSGILFIALGLKLAVSKA